jgi:hypothetical protein
MVPATTPGAAAPSTAGGVSQLQPINKKKTETGGDQVRDSDTESKNTDT